MLILAVPSLLVSMSDWYQAMPNEPWKAGSGLPLASWFECSTVNRSKARFGLKPDSVRFSWSAVLPRLTVADTVGVLPGALRQFRLAPFTNSGNVVVLTLSARPMAIAGIASAATRAVARASCH